MLMYFFGGTLCLIFTCSLFLSFALFALRLVDYLLFPFWPSRLLYFVYLPINVVCLFCLNKIDNTDLDDKTIEQTQHLQLYFLSNFLNFFDKDDKRHPNKRSKFFLLIICFIYSYKTLANYPHR